jgi:hypothetical protein
MKLISLIFFVFIFGFQSGASELPGFFSEIYKNHKEKIESKFYDSYSQACCELGIEPKNKKNREKITPLFFYHKLFTSVNATDCTTGGILNIPYFWHWIDPNPRHKIIYKPGSKKLKFIAPPHGFKKYKSYADIDRLPGLYLSDLVTESPKFYHPSCGSFYTFGWCSEREMAFNTLLTILGYECKVKQEGIHVWSEIYMILEGNNKKSITSAVKVDNTFDTITFILIKIQKEKWEKDFGNGTQVKWYNLKSHSSSEIEAVRNIQVSDNVSKRIETLIKSK